MPVPAPLCRDPRIGVEWYLPPSELPESDDGRAIVFLDIDNTLYSRATDPSIASLMKEKIRAYFESIGLAPAEAERLHKNYYRSYGLAIRGLVKHHDIDPLDYDQKCDAALPLQDILRPNPELVRLVANLDRTKCRVVALTNAYRVHARRVLDLVHLTPYIEGCIYCDYAMEDFACKPEPEFYLAAMDAVGTRAFDRCYFVDDSLQNVRAAHALGWRSSIFFDEAVPPSGEPYKVEGVDWVITQITQLGQVWSHLLLPQDAPADHPGRWRAGPLRNA